MNEVFSIVRQNLWPKSDGWSEWPRCEHSFMVYTYVCHSSSCCSILGKIIRKICDLPRINPWSLWDKLFQTTARLITDQAQNYRIDHDWLEAAYVERNLTLSCDRAVQIANSKTYAFSDSVLCLGSLSDKPVEAWEDRIKWFLETRYLKKLDRIDGEPMEFEWTKFPRIHYHWDILDEIQKMTTESKVWTRAIQRKDHLHVDE